MWWRRFAETTIPPCGASVQYSWLVPGGACCRACVWCGCPLLQLREVERLLTLGSSVYSLDSNGDTPLDLASRAGCHVSHSSADMQGN